MWRTAAIAATLPILLTMAFEFVPALCNHIALWIASVVHLLYVWRAASIIQYNQDNNTSPLSA